MRRLWSPWLALLAVVVAPALAGNMGGPCLIVCPTQDVAVKSLKLIWEALALYRLANGRYPTDAEGLAALTDIQPSGQPILPVVPVDPWGNAYRYARTADGVEPSYRVWSLGPDGRDGTADDIDGRSPPAPPDRGTHPGPATNDSQR